MRLTPPGIAPLSNRYDEQALLTISEAAAYLNVSKITIRRWTNDGRLPCCRVGGRRERRFRVADLQKLISEPHRVAENNGDGFATTGGVHCCVLCDDSIDAGDAIFQQAVLHLSNGTQVTFVGDTKRNYDLANVISKSDMDFDTLVQSGRLRLLSLDDSYLISGKFSGAHAATFVESTILEGIARGFERTLFVGWSDWVFDVGDPDLASSSTEVIEYERNLNRLLERYPHATVLCPYSLSKVDATMLIDIVHHHPDLQFQAQSASGAYTVLS